MILYKLTDQNGCTHNGIQWGPGITHAGEDGDGEVVIWAGMGTSVTTLRQAIDLARHIREEEQRT